MPAPVLPKAPNELHPPNWPTSFIVMFWTVEPDSASLSGTIDSVAFNGDRQRLVVSGASVKPLTVDAPNTVKVKSGDRVGLSIAQEAVRLLPSED